MGTPFDVMKSRMMNQPYSNGKGEFYKSTIDCLIKTVQLWPVLILAARSLVPPHMYTHLGERGRTDGSVQRVHPYVVQDGE